MNDLVARAKADPEAFRRETVRMMRAAFRALRAAALECDDVDRALRSRWIWDEDSPPEHRANEERAKAHNDALLQALTEMTPDERERLGW